MSNASLQSNPHLITPTRIQLNKQTPIHFIGIGGGGMSGLAQILADEGFTVSGSDLSESPRTEALQAAGAIIHIGHHETNIGKTCRDGILVYNTAIREDNPEWLRAKELGMTFCHRSDMLQAILEQHPLGFTHTVGVTGTHGKTTLTGMMGSILKAHSPKTTSIIAGGRLPGVEVNVIYGNEKREFGVAELDESDGSLIAYHPTLTLITNLELDHADHFPDGLEGLKNLFVQFFKQLATEGSHSTHPPVVVANLDCPTLAPLLKPFETQFKIIWVSVSKENTEADYWLTQPTRNEHGGYNGLVVTRKNGLAQNVGNISLTVPGQHNLWNATMAAAAAEYLQVPLATMQTALLQFPGMGRRFERVGTYNQAILIDDYGHHPTELAVTIQATRDWIAHLPEPHRSGRLIAIFEPHRYTRLQALWNEFTGCFGAADVVWVTDIYSAFEDPIPGISTPEFCKVLAQRVNPNQEAGHLAGDILTMAETLKPTLRPNDVVITLGAGNVTKLLRTIAE